jgi:hypothetical protein
VNGTGLSSRTRSWPHVGIEPHGWDQPKLILRPVLATTTICCKGDNGSLFLRTEVESQLVSDPSLLIKMLRMIECTLVAKITKPTSVSAS